MIAQVQDLQREFKEHCWNQKYPVCSSGRWWGAPGVFGVHLLRGILCVLSRTAVAVLPRPLSFTEFILSLYSCTSYTINNLLVSASE